MAQINWGIIVSLVSLAITVFTIVYSNAKNSEHTNSRIDVIETKLEHLDSKVEKHNQMVERTYLLEQKTAVMQEELKVEQHRMTDVENELKERRQKNERTA